MLDDLRRVFKGLEAGVGHLKCALTAGGRSMWANLTGLDTQPAVSDQRIGSFDTAALLINARVQLEPDQLEKIVRAALQRAFAKFGIDYTVVELQCFSPAYPAPPYLMR